MNRSVALALFCCAIASGCASLTGSEMQDILVSTQAKDGESVEKADCQLQSPKGTWKVSTPSSVSVARSGDDMQVDCKKDGMTPGLAKLISRVNGGMVGNIVFGGGIGAIIDHSKGTGYSYPNKVMVVMGENVVIDRRDEEKQQPEKAAASGK